MAGNWKMYKTAAETTAFFEAFSPLVSKSNHAEIVICPPFVDIPAAVDAARGTNIAIGAQDLFWLKEGAYTGEVSAPMLVASGCRWVIVGHSERRQYFGETEELLKQEMGERLARVCEIGPAGENLVRYAGVVNDYKDIAGRTDTRFLIITHHRVTMARMDRLYGVTMAEQGVSQLVSVNLQEADRMVA